MDDTIYRRAAIVALLEKGQHSRRYKLGDIWELNFDEIREAIDALPAAKPKSYRMGYQAGYAAAQRWTPCSKELPKKDGDYYVTTHDGQIARYMFIKGMSEEYWMRCAVAWRPLPEPYKEDDHG